MIEFLLFDRSRQFKRMLVPGEVHAELLNNEVSFADLVFDDDAPDLAVVENGSRVEMRVDGVAQITGPIVKRSGSRSAGKVTLTVEDDFRLFRNIVWPNSAQAIGSQTSEYRRFTGPTETVAKAAAADLSALYGFGWTVTATTGLGSAQRVEYRFHPMVDKVVPLLDAGGLSLTIRGDVVDVKPGTLFPRILTVDSGVLGDYKWSISAPTATRVVVGGEGEGVARTLQQFINTGRETDWGAILAVFKDSRMAQGVTDLGPDGAEALALGSGAVSVTADLVETSWFKFGKYKVGDRVRVQIGPVDTTETITQVVIDDTADNGLTIVPHLGPIVDDGESQLAADVARLQARVRDLGGK